MRVKAFILLCLVLLSLSCSLYHVKIEETHKLDIIDFTEYSDKGFLFLTETYSGEYETRGIIEYTYIPEYEAWEEFDEEKRRVTIIKRGYTDIYKALSLAYEESLKLGGDAIMNLKLSSTDPDSLPMIYLYGVIIDRKE